MGSGFGQIPWDAGAFGTSVGTGQSLAVKDVILYRALRLAQITRGPGRTANPEQFQDALGCLNDLFDSLNIQKDAIYSVNNVRYTLAPPKRVYTIGIDPLGLQTADFATPRPNRIDRARLVLTASPTPVYLPLRVVRADEWSTISVRDVPVTIPQILYCDYDYPIANLYFWGYPTQANDVELWTWQPLTQFNTILDQVILPMGYRDMLIYNLAVRLSDQFGTALPPNVMSEARKTLGRVKAQNAPSMPMGSTDAGTESTTAAAGGGTWNYMTGMP